MYLDLLLSLTR